MDSAAGWLLMPDRLHPEHLEPTDVGQRITDGGHLPVEDRADFTAGEREVARLGVTVHQGDPRAGLGLAVAQRLPVAAPARAADRA